MSGPISLQYIFQCRLALIGNYIEHAPELSVFVIMLMPSFSKFAMIVPYNFAENVFFAAIGELSECIQFTKSRVSPRWPTGTSLIDMMPLPHDSEVPWHASGRGFWEVPVKNACTAGVQSHTEPPGLVK